MSVAPLPVDEQLVDAFRRGDDDAVRELYRRYGRLVFSVAHRVLGDRSLAEEATQQAFVQAWRGAASFEAGRDPAPWLATIARRAAIDVQRREARRPSTPLDGAPAGDSALVTLAPSIEAVWETWEVRRAIEQLPADERTVVELQHLHGHTHAEIADRLGLALGTVKSRSFRAHRALAARLGHLRAGPAPPEPDG